MSMQKHRRAMGLAVIAAVLFGLLWYLSTAPAAPIGGVPPSATTPIVYRAPTPAKATGTDIVSVIAAIPAASTFSAYLSSTGVAKSLTGAGPYTVFVPADTAFAALAKGSITGLSAAQQKRLVEYHVVSGKMLDADAVLSGTYYALSRDALNFSVPLNGSKVYVNSAVVTGQYKASNGIIYTVSSVLFPPTSSGTIHP